MTAEVMQGAVASLPSSPSKLAGGDNILQSTTASLFGLEKLDANMLSYQPPKSRTVSTRGGPPVYEIVTLKQPLRLSTIIPELKGTIFDELVLEDVLFTRQNFSIPGGRGAGLHFDAILTVDDAAGDLHSLLSKVLGCKDPKMELYCGMGYFESWSELPQLSSFTLQSTLPNINIGEEFKLTSLGIRIFAFETSAASDGGSIEELEMSVGFGVFGTLSIQVPSWNHPIVAEFAIEKMSSIVQLSTTAHLEWKDAFGVSGLTLADVRLGATLDLDKPLSAQIFEIGASFGFGGTAVAFDGAFSLGGKFTLSAVVQGLTWADLELLYYELFGEKLPRPDVDIKLRQGVLIISNEGFSLSVDHLEISGLPPTSGTISMKTSGVHFDVSIKGEALNVGDFSISNPQVSITSYRGAKSEIIISGDFHWESFNLKVGLHAYPSPSGDGSFEYTVCGAFVLDNPGAGLRFGRLIPPLEGTGFGNVTLDGAALVYASREGAILPGSMTTTFPIRKGFFICANIGHLDAIASFIDGASPNLSLAAGWTRGQGFTISINANDIKIDLGGDFESQPLKFDLILADSPIIQATCGVKLKLEGQDPLIFGLNAVVKPAGGELDLTAYMDGMWKNPFGLSPHLQIGNVSLGLKLVGGRPSGILVAGQLKMKSSVISAVIVKGALPGENFLKLHFEKIGPREIVEMAEEILGWDLPEPPQIFYFQVADLYVCAKDAMINGTFYKKGLSFHADMTLFGKQIRAVVELSDSGFLVEGEVEPFSIGPLTVAGYNGDKLRLKLHMLKHDQSGEISGGMTLTHVLRTDFHFKFSMKPNFSIEFWFGVNIVDSIGIAVRAQPVKSVDAGNASSCDISGQRYKLHASFEQHVLSRVKESVHKSLKEAGEALQRGADEAKEWIDKKEREFSQALEDVKWHEGDWRSKDSWRREQFVDKLKLLIERHIELHPKDVPSDAASQIQNVYNRYADDKSDYYDLRERRDRVVRERNPVRGVPVVGSVVGFFTNTVSHIEEAADYGIRGPMKDAETKFLRTQRDVVKTVMDILPWDARSSLQPMLNEIQATVNREVSNNAVEDLLENLVDDYMEFIGELLNAAISLIQAIGKAVAAVAKGAVIVGNAAGQAALKFVDGFFMKLLGLLDIQRVELTAEIGGGINQMKFAVTVSGILMDDPFHINLTLEIGNWSFIDFIKSIFE
ncbi:hypothetical protein DL93DRAFT_2165474 [Clavulina sp. PMI_390]|nr:hypothetical protein DL93DRAFT_2165474 [Clavulina sp. PMI_390]